MHHLFGAAFVGRNNRIRGGWLERRRDAGVGGAGGRGTRDVTPRTLLYGPLGWNKRIGALRFTKPRP